LNAGRWPGVSVRMMGERPADCGSEFGGEMRGEVEPRLGRVLPGMFGRLALLPGMFGRLALLPGKRCGEMAGLRFRFWGTLRLEGMRSDPPLELAGGRDVPRLGNEREEPRLGNEREEPKFAGAEGRLSEGVGRTLPKPLPRELEPNDGMLPLRPPTRPPL